jgi:hypothetical protein
MIALFERDPVVPLLIGGGLALTAGGASLLVIGATRKTRENRWARDTGQRPPPSGHGLIVGGSLAAAGGAALIGAYAWALQQAARTGTCGPGTGCEDERQALGLGIATGVLAVGAGGLLLGLGARRKLRYDRWIREIVLAPTGAWARGGGMLGLSGRF